MELFAGEEIMDSLVERVVLGDEMLPLPPHSLAVLGIGQIIAAPIEALLEILVPRAVIAFA